MSVSIESLSICPHCQSDLTADPSVRKGSCWNCGRILVNPINKYFESPEYIYNQKSSLLEFLEQSNLKPGDTKYEEKIQEIQKELTNWVRGCKTEDKLAALFDSTVILENLLFTETPVQDLRTIISMGKKIGTLANALEQYFKAGGTSYDRKAGPIRTDIGEGSWDQATATASRNS
jgi:hypothetical protein